MGQVEFDRLEDFVANLLEKYDSLKTEYGKLETLLAQRDEEIAILEEEISSAESERGQISSRVKGLIDQIEEWESGHVQVPGAPESMSTQGEGTVPTNSNTAENGEHVSYGQVRVS